MRTSRSGMNSPLNQATRSLALTDISTSRDRKQIVGKLTGNPRPRQTGAGHTVPSRRKPAISSRP